MRAILIVAVTCALLLPAGALAQGTPPEQAAAKALETFTLMVDDQNYRRMGFESPGQLREASLGEPIEELTIPLAVLKAGEPAGDSEKILEKSVTRHYPLVIQNRVLSEVTIRCEGDNWKPSGFGGIGHVRDMSQMRQRLAAEKNLKSHQIFEVAVPQLQISFMGYKEDGHLFLTPLYSDRRLGFTTGVPIRAEQVIEALRPMARELPG